MNLALTLRQMRAVISIYIQEGFAYRASGVIWIMTDMSTAVSNNPQHHQESSSNVLE